ncbi:MAG: hypothetical protein U5J96_15625 [Ignavibacteriaceae bacterium]|nr:hypothetical protein [Ignavibacteriaceae bacterium]
MQIFESLRDYVLKKGNQVNLKSKVDSCFTELRRVLEEVILFKRSKEEVETDSGKEIIWPNEIDKVSDDCEAVPLLIPTSSLQHVRQ